MILLARKVTEHKVHIKADLVNVKCCHSHMDLVCISIGNMKTYIIKTKVIRKGTIIHSHCTNTQYGITENNCNLIYLDLIYADFGNASKLLSHLLHN